jgi:tRNA-intron endonuclease
MQPFTAVYSANKIIVPTQCEADSLRQDGYGVKGDTLILDSFEALYNVERGKLKVIDEKTNTIISFQELLQLSYKKDEKAWTKFIVYKDLRTRGFVTRKSSKENQYFEIYERGTYKKEPPKYRIHIIMEDKPEHLSDLHDKIRNHSKSSMEMKIAAVDRRGEIVYYGVNEKKWI